MARMLGLAQFGKGLADTAVRSYATIKEIQRRESAEKRAQEVHEQGAPVREAAGAEAEEKLETIGHTREARTLAQAAAEEYDTLSSPQPLPLSAASGEVVTGDSTGEQTDLSARMPAATSPKPTVGKNFYIAQKVADFHRSKGRNEEATKTLTKAYTDAIAENEARFNFDLLPKMQKFKESGLDRDQLRANKEYQQLEWDMYQAQIANLGHIYGLMKAGNKQDAITAFNRSGVVLPGVQVTDVRIISGDDGTPQVVAYDKDGNVAKDTQGNALARPQAWFERVWKLGQTQTMKIGAKDRIVTVTKDEKGGITTQEVLPPNDPDAARNKSKDELAADKAWGEALNKERDDAAKYLKDTLGLTANALGQVMNPNNQPLFEKALPKVTVKLQAMRGQGKKLDQINGVAIAKEALAEARDELKREKAGAGPRNQPGAKKPTVKDIIGG